MKNLLVAFVFLFSLSLQAQDVRVPLTPYTFQRDSVNTLLVRPVGGPFRASNPADTAQKYLAQTIYYELIRTKSGIRQVVETKNMTVPMGIYLLINNFVDKSITPAQVAYLNGFFLQNGFPELVAKMPD